jgi:hypothetical protein
MFSSFPSDFCTDGGRAIINAGAPPINKPDRAELAARSGEMPGDVGLFFTWPKSALEA